MTEAEWLACGDPEPMLKALRGRASERKLRLFALACCSRLDHLITDPRSRAAVDFAERHVDAGLTRRRGKKSVLKAARAAWKDAYGRLFKVAEKDRAACLVASNAADAAAATVHEDARLGAGYAASFSAYAVGWGLMSATAAARLDLDRTLCVPEQAQQAALLRDIFGDPFHPVALAPASRTAAAVALAQGTYDERAFDRLPILADALEDAGCADRAILDHLRGPGPHVRGCWALDLILGKE
jgi:hypothetical protein